VPPDSGRINGIEGGEKRYLVAPREAVSAKNRLIPELTKRSPENLLIRCHSVKAVLKHEVLNDVLAVSI
jgi:hypothetical protein